MRVTVQKPSAEPIAAQSTADRVDLQVRQQIPANVAEPIAAQSTADRVDLQVRQQIPAIVAASDDGGGNDTDVM